jgi:DNA replication initiation complex subunit (GINS family)
MLKFLTRAVNQVQDELRQVLTMPEQQVISSVEDTLLLQQKEISQSLKKRKAPR